jgi:hypothetical protein
MKTWRRLVNGGLMLLLLALPGMVHAQWWQVVAGGGTGLVAGSDNNNPGPGCSADIYSWVVFPVYELEIQVPAPKSAGVPTSVYAELVAKQAGLVQKVDGCTGMISYLVTAGYPVADWTWTRSSDGGSTFSGTCSGASCTAYFTPTATGIINFKVGGVLGWSASAQYRVLVNERLAYWRFNGSWIGEGGQAPTAAVGLENPASWSGQALDVDTTGGYIKYPAFEPDGFPNITRDKGTIRFWFKPTVVTGATRKLIEISGSAPWELRLSSSGYLQLATRQSSGGSETSFQHSTLLTVNTWYQIAVTYSSSTATIYLNGSTSTSGGFASASSPTVNGFSIGNGYASQSFTALGEFEEFETFNYALSGSTISTDYAAFTSQISDPDGDGVNNLDEITAGTNIYEADTDGDGYPDGVDYYPTDPTRWQAPPATNPSDTTPPTIQLWTPLNT